MEVSREELNRIVEEKVSERINELRDDRSSSAHEKDRENEDRCSRRDFLKKAGAGALALGAGAFATNAGALQLKTGEGLNILNENEQNFSFDSEGVYQGKQIGSPRKKIKQIYAENLKTESVNKEIIVQPEWSASDLNEKTGKGVKLVFKPHTEYIYEDSIKLHSFMTVEGPGEVVWELRDDRPTDQTIVIARHDGPAFEPVSTSVQGVTMRDLAIDGDKHNTEAGYCLNLGEQKELPDGSTKRTQWFQRFHIENLSLLEAPDGGIYMDRPFNGVIKDCSFRRFGEVGGDADSFHLTDTAGSVPSHFKFINNDFRGGPADEPRGRDHIHVEHCQGFYCAWNDANHAGRNIAWIKNTNGGTFFGNRGEPANETVNGFVFGSAKDETRVVGAMITGNHSHASGRTPSGIGLDLRRVSRTVVRGNSIKGYPTEISTNAEGEKEYVVKCEYGMNVPRIGTEGWDMGSGASSRSVDTTRVNRDGGGDVRLRDGSDSARISLFNGGPTSIRHGNGDVIGQFRRGGFRSVQGEIQLGESGAALYVNSQGEIVAEDEEGNQVTLT